MKRVLFPLFLILVFILSSCTVTLSDEQKDKIIMKAFTDGDIEKAKQKVVELYKDDEVSALAWLTIFNEAEGNNYKDKLVIQQGWTWERDGNYSYVRGRVKNTSDKDMEYFEVTAEYLDKNGQVLDSDYTNSGELLKVGNQKEFEIMHKHDNQYEQVRIYVNKVSVE